MPGFDIARSALGALGTTVEVSEVESLADGTIIVGDGSGAPTTLAAFLSATGALKHEYGGIEANISAVAIGDIIAGTGAGTTGLVTASGHSDGDVLTLQADGSADWETPSSGIGGSTGGTDNAILRADGVGGSTLQATSITIDDSDNLNMAASTALQFAGTAILSDAAGTMTLSNIDALDATTEATIEAAIDTLANLTSVQGLTVTLADAGANAIFGWDDAAGAYENLSQAEVLAVIGDAGAAAKGVVELATAAETTTGTDATRAVTPDGLAGSDFGIRYVQVQLFAPTTEIATGDGAAYFFAPAALGGMNIVSAQAFCVTAGTGTGVQTIDIQLHNLTQAADVFSTKLTIDEDETTSETAATAVVINTSEDDVTASDVYRLDVDAVPGTTPGNGLFVILGFQLP